MDKNMGKNGGVVKGDASIFLDTAFVLRGTLGIVQPSIIIKVGLK
jgi:hypothetical protein